MARVTVLFKHSQDGDATIEHKRFWFSFSALRFWHKLRERIMEGKINETRQDYPILISIYMRSKFGVISVSSPEASIVDKARVAYPEAFGE